MLYLLVLPLLAFHCFFAVSDNRTLIPVIPHSLGFVHVTVSLFVSVTTGCPRAPAGPKKPVFSRIFSFCLFNKVLAATCPSLQNMPIFRVDSMFGYRTKKTLCQPARSNKPRNFQGFLFSSIGQTIFDSRFSIFDSREIAALKLPIQNPKSRIQNP